MIELIDVQNMRSKEKKLIATLHGIFHHIPYLKTDASSDRETELTEVYIRLVDTQHPQL